MTDIIINDLRPRTQIIQATEPDGTTNLYHFGFPILAKSDLKVAVNDTVLDESAYSVAGEGQASGGTISFNIAEPSVGSRITMWRDMPFERTTDFTPGADLRATVLNDELDRTALLLQQAEALVGDSLHRRPYDLDQELVLPTVTDRAGKYLSFDVNGVPEAVNTRILGDIGNLALVYSGAHATAPTLRLDGSALQDGDLYFDTTADAMNVRSNGEWMVAYVDTAALLPLSGALAMQGNLDMGGNAIDGVTTVDGIDVSVLSSTVDALASQGGVDEDARTLAIRNAWEIARMEGLSALTMANTYQDVFEDRTGVDEPVSGDNALLGIVPTSNLANYNGSFDLITDGSIGAVTQMTGPNNSGVDYDFDLGAGNEVALVRFRSYHSQFFASPSVFTVKASTTGAFAGEEHTFSGVSAMDSLADDSWGEITWSNTTAYRYWRFTVDAVRNANNSQRPVITEMEGYPVAVGGLSANTIYNETLKAFESNTGETFTINSFNGAVTSVSGTTITMNTANASGYSDAAAKLVGDFDISFTVDAQFNTIERIGIIREINLGILNTAYYYGANCTGTLGFSLNSTSRGIEKDASAANIGTAPSPTAGTVYRMVRTGADVAMYEDDTLLHTEVGWGTDDMRICIGHHNNSVAWTVGYSGKTNITSAAMSLISNTITADAPPEEARLLLDIEVLNAATINTDVLAYVSRDDGTTWSLVTLTRETGGTSARAIHSGSTIWPAGGSDKALRLRLDTTASAKMRLHQWALQTDQALSL